MSYGLSRMAAPLAMHHDGATDAGPKLVNRLHESRSPYVSSDKPLPSRRKLTRG